MKQVLIVSFAYGIAIKSDKTRVKHLLKIKPGKPFGFRNYAFNLLRMGLYADKLNLYFRVVIGLFH